MTIKTYKNQENKRFALFWIIRILIIIFIFLELQSDRGLILYLYILVFLLTFIPSIIQRMFSVSLPFEFEFIFLLFLLATLSFENILTGFFVQLVLGMFFGFVGFFIMYILYHNSKIKSSHYLFALISFCIAVSLGAVWEVFRYALMVLVEARIGDMSIDYAPQGLIITMLGAVIVLIPGYFYLRYGEGKVTNRLLSSFRRKNPKLFIDHDTDPKQLVNLIKKGENEKLEFKSTLRINMHTKKPDKKIEYSFLKTINAFLNTDGGTLLVGVSDNGIVNGIEKDGFQNNDKFYQHFTNLIKNHIGNEYLPFIKSNIIEIDKKNILKIDCSPSDKEVFLKIDNDEDFYVRSGPASVKLVGKKLIDYVNRKFVFV